MMNFEGGICTQVDPEIFSPARPNTKAGMTLLAIKLCRRCDLLADCRDGVITGELETDNLIVGGWTPNEQDKMKGDKAS